jgi:hypothetical protein
MQDDSCIAGALPFCMPNPLASILFGIAKAWFSELEIHLYQDNGVFPHRREHR